MILIRRLALQAAAMLVLLPAANGAHPLTFTETTVVLQRDGSFRAGLLVDLNALALGGPQSADNAEPAAAMRGLSPGRARRGHQPAAAALRVAGPVALSTP